MSLGRAFTSPKIPPPPRVMEKHGLFRGGVVHLFRGPDLKTSGFLIFLISLIIDLYQVQIWRPPFF